MSYLQYVVAAYAIFVVVLAWDFIAPHVQLRQLHRAARLRAARRSRSDAPPSSTENA